MTRSFVSCLGCVLVALALVACGPDPTPYQPPTCTGANCGTTPGPTGCGDRAPTLEGANLPVPGLYQQCQVWCWAAAVGMVTAYYGKPYQECYLASVLLYGQQGAYYAPCCNMNGCQTCGRGAYTAELGNLLRAAGLYNTTGGTLTERQLMNELYNGRPVIIFYQGSFSGHFVVVSGYQLDPMLGAPTYNVLDPWFGPATTHYQMLVAGYQNGQSRWAQSIYRISPRADGCNPSFDPSCGCDTSGGSEN